MFKYGGIAKMSKFCTNCGKRLNTNGVFCPNCGTRIVEDTDVSQNKTIENKQENYTSVEENPYCKEDDIFSANTEENQMFEGKGFKPEDFEKSKFMPPYGLKLDYYDLSVADCSGKGLSIVGFVSAILYFLQSFSVFAISSIPCFVVGLVFSILSVVGDRKCAIKAFTIISYILLGVGFIIQIISVALYIGRGLYL